MKISKPKRIAIVVGQDEDLDSCWAGRLTANQEPTTFVAVAGELDPDNDGSCKVGLFGQYVFELGQLLVLEQTKTKLDGESYYLWRLVDDKK